jgi:peroxiredoxin/putative intracellular protease/amidase
MTSFTRRSFLQTAAGVGFGAMADEPKAQAPPGFDPSQPLPANLPVPVDDGACRHLPGLPVPSIKLRSTRDRWVDLSAVSAPRAVVYCYPRTGVPAQPLLPGWDAIPGARGCTPETCGFRDHHKELQQLGAEVFGFSTQTTEYQKEMVERLHVPFEVLSDVDLAFVRALRLPTFDIEGMTLVKRLTLVISRQHVEKVFYPVFPPDTHAAEVMEWLRGHPAEAEAGEKVIALVAFPELTLLDVVGPLQVLKSLPAPYRTVVVGESKEPMATDTGLTVTPERTFAEVPRPFAVIVPGGPGSVAAMGSRAVQDYLRSAAPGAEVVGSVCTGALVLAAAGLLDGHRATTHWAYASELEKLGARYVRERWVEDGKLITAGGVSAGIDMALALVARLTDRATAQRIQLGIEYDPHPPHGAIDWSHVGEAERARQRQGGTGRRLKDASRLLAGRPDLLRRLGIEREP